MLDFSKETNLKFLRAAGNMLAVRVFELEKELAQVKHEKKIEEDLLKVLTADLDLLRKKFFDSSSEKRPGVNASKGKPSKDRLLHNHRLVDNSLLNSDTKLTQEEVIHTELPVTTFDEEGNGICGCGDGTFVPMSGAFEESSEIDVMDRIYILRRHKRQQCKCTLCGKIIAAKGPLKLKPGAEFSVQMAVQVVDDKFHRHIPLNRQAEMMSERGLQVGTKTLYSLSEHLMGLLKKIPSLIRAEIHSRDHIHIDESPMDLFNPKTRGYVWSITNQIGAYYQFETTRSGKVAKEMILGYRGIVMADGYAGYEFLEKDSGVILSLCMAHIRRKFVDAKNSYSNAEDVLDLFEQLYDVEREAKDFDELGKLRLEKSSMIMNSILEWIKNQAGKYLENSPIGKAINHTLDHWERLNRFLTDPKIPLDNNSAERSQRRPVMGRRNFQGFRTINGADTGMFFYTIVETCKIIGISPKTYLLEMALRSLKGEELLSPYQYGLEIDAKVRAGVALHEAPKNIQ